MMIYFKCKGTFVIGSRKTVVYGCVGFLPSSVTAFLVRVDSKKWYESVFMIWSQGILHTHTPHVPAELSIMYLPVCFVHFLSLSFCSSWWLQLSLFITKASKGRS